MASSSFDSLERELGFPDDATLDPRGISAKLETSSTAAISISSATCTRPNGRCLVVGRQAAAADICVQHKSISRKHAALYFFRNKLYVKDLGGKYGTFVNTVRVVENDAIELNNGDIVLFGNVRESVFRIVLTENPAIIHEGELALPENNPAQDNHTQSRIEKAGQGLSGRAKRQAEIAAMMQSLDETPTYQKIPVPEDSAPKNIQVASSLAEQYQLPISLHFTLPSESARKNVATCLAVDPAGSRFVVGSSDTHVRYYDFGGLAKNRNGCFQTIIPEDGHLLVSCAYSQTGDRIIVGTSSVQPIVFDRDGGEIIKFVRGDMYVTDQTKTVGHTASVTCVDWHPLERDLVLTSSNDGSARLWNLNGKTQFKMLTCEKVFPAKNARGQRTPVTCVCFHPAGREFALGTACGSIQIWNRNRVSGRPERAAFETHGQGNAVSNLTYNKDGTMLASRSGGDDKVKIWNSTRLSRSAEPSIVCIDLPTIHEQANASFSANGKFLCASTSVMRRENDIQKEGGRLCIFNLSGGSTTVQPLVALELEGESVPVITKWHGKLNQILAGCSNGSVVIFYDPTFSNNGALLAAARAERSDDLSDLLRSRASNTSTIVTGEIITPFSLPLFRQEQAISEKKRKRSERKDPKLSKEPERPATGKHKAGAQIGSNTTFQQFVADQTGEKAKQIAGEDPRNALFKFGTDDNDLRKAADKKAQNEVETEG
jgi:WD40 repeat protein